jgi:lysophospholipase L1-like esterase
VHVLEFSFLDAIIVVISFVFYLFYKFNTRDVKPKPFHMNVSQMFDMEIDVEVVKILTFGASLTEGYYNSGRQFHPYSNKLETLINTFYIDRKLSKEALIHQFGRSGETTTQMIPRLRGILNDAKSSPYKFVCILAGTNDLGQSDTGDEIFGRLTQLYDMVLNHGDKQTILVAITIPQSFYTDTRYVARRGVVNQRIKDFCLRCNTGSRNRAILVDFETLLPYQTPGSVLWDDPLHMTPAGYDKLGQLIFEHIRSSLL